MKKAMSIYAFPNEWDIKKVFTVAKKAGFDGVELDYGTESRLNPNTTDEELKEIRAIADEVGIELKSLSSGFSWFCSPTSDDEETRIAAKALIKGLLYTAHKLGAESVLIVPGYCGVDSIPGTPVVNYLDVYNRALEWMNEYKGLAEELNVDIAIENVGNKFLLSPLDMRNIIDQVNSPKVGCYFDVGNIMPIGYPEQWIKILRHRIKKLHFKDYDRSTGMVRSYVQLLKGNVDYTAVMEALKEIGYDGWATAEYTCPEGIEPEAYLKTVADAMENIFRRI